MTIIYLFLLSVPHGTMLRVSGEERKRSCRIGVFVMVEMKYVLTIFFNIVCDGEVVDEQMEQEYYNTRDEAEAVVNERYQVGTIDGYYDSDTLSVVSETIISDEPEPIDFV